MFKNPRHQKSILAIDRWSKYVGLAYKNESSEVIFPVGYLLNDQMIFFHIWDLIQRHHVKTIVIGRPRTQEDVQDKIIKFMQSLNFIIENEEITIERVNEDYTSVQSGEIVSNFKKNVAEDTVSAMIILERRSKKWNKVEE